MTVNVTVTLLDEEGAALVGARVEAKLFVPSDVTDFVVPAASNVSGTTDSNGQAVLALWPNSSNTSVSTYYKFRARHPTTKEKVLETCAYVDTAANLEDIDYNCRTQTASTADPESIWRAKWKGAVEKTASYVLTAADAFYMIEMNVATANTLTVPPNSSAAFTVGDLVHVRQLGAGQTTVVAGSGVTIRTAETLKMRKQYSNGTLEKRGTDEWVLYGDLEMA